MTLLIDKRIGSGELAKYLSVLHVPVEVTSLTYGDMAFLGCGEAGMPVPVGIERKTLSDFITSARSGRLTDQLRGMHQCYEVVFVVVEGLYRADYTSGVVVIPKGKKWVPLAETIGGTPILSRELHGMILTLTLRGGAHVWVTAAKHETGRFLSTLYHWWTDKDLDQHRSHLRIHSALTDRALLVKPSLCRRWAADLPGIGWERSGPVAQHFGAPALLALAPPEEWARIPVGTDKHGHTLTVGVKRAQTIVDAIWQIPEKA